VAERPIAGREDGRRHVVQIGADLAGSRIIDDFKLVPGRIGQTGDGAAFGLGVDLDPVRAVDEPDDVVNGVARSREVDIVKMGRVLEMKKDADVPLIDGWVRIAAHPPAEFEGRHIVTRPQRPGCRSPDRLLYAGGRQFIDRRPVLLDDAPMGRVVRAPFRGRSFLKVADS